MKEQEISAPSAYKLTDYFSKFVGQKCLYFVGPLYQSGQLPPEPLIFVDGGVNFRQDESLGFSVGDGDSSANQMDLLLDKKKSVSDLGYTLGQIPQSFEQIQLLGFLGGRADHQLMNFAEVHGFLKSHQGQARVQFDNEVFAYSKGSWDQSFEGQFSIFTFEQVQIEIEGAVDFPIPQSNELKPLSSHGLSNLSRGPFRVQSDGPWFMFRSIWTPV